MLRYIAARSLSSFWALAMISVLVFAMMHLQGDPAVLFVNPDLSTPEDLAAIRAQFGFDQPLYRQYFSWLSNVAQGDFGESLRHRAPALPLIIDRLPATLRLAGAAFALAMFLGIPLGLLSGLHRGKWIDRGTMLVAMAGLSVPSFLLGLMLILLFSVKLHWLPSFGGEGVKSLVLPAVTLAVYTAAVLARLSRSSILEVIHQDYVRTARAKGLPPRLVLLRHSLRNAAIPIVTILGLRLAVLLSGSIVVETVFAYPGIGLLAVQSVLGRDTPLVMAFTLLFALAVVVINLLVDLSYAYLDPRVKYG